MYDKFHILTPTKDTVINSYYDSANLGKSFVLPLKNYQDTEFSRILIDFDFDDLLDHYTSSSLTSNLTATFKMYELKSDLIDHTQNYTVLLYNSLSAWTEGFNYEYDFSQDGYCNWNNRDSINSWSASGGDYGVVIGQQTFESGYEDLEIDISTFLKNWFRLKLGLSSNISGISTSADYRGMLLRYSDESSTAFEESKNFYSRHTNTIFNPKIYIEFEKTAMIDNRNSFLCGKEQTLYLSYSIGGEIQNYTSTTALPFSFIIKKDTVTLTALTASYTGTEVSNGLFKVAFTLPQSYYSSTSIFEDVWTINNGISITGQFKVYTQSDALGLDYFSLTGNFNKNYETVSLMEKIGIISKYNKKMYYGTTQYLNFNPYIKKGGGVDNLGMLFNNDLYFPNEMYVKIIDVYSGYEWTNWLRLDLLNGRYNLKIFTESFSVGAKCGFLYKIKYLDDYKIIKSTPNDTFEIIRDY